MNEVILVVDDDSARDYTFDIQTAGRNLLSVVSDILDFSELESGKMDLIEEPYNITSTVNDVMNMAVALKNNKNVELIVDCDASIPRNLLGDEQKLRRVIMNLVSNAIKFTREGYADSIERMARQLRVSFQLCRNLLELKRRIEKKKYTHIFISWEEYCEDKPYFDALAEKTKVVLILDRENDSNVNRKLLKIYKPFYVLSAVSVINGESVVQSIDSSTYANHRFIAPKASVLVVDEIKQGRMGCSCIETENIKTAYKKYIRQKMRGRRKIDNRILFITYTGCSIKTLEMIQKEVERYMKFEKVVFQPASATISSNCGLGAFGLLYMKKKK